ncbi:MAG: holo-ACP synthase [Candidatus Cohnella colombiensis]|uniref:Holo-[acyl-carrier-protein] synthase n=1 Tax=Candidatus Cohnella colombiensis TaxID=3121368 RepID=A0AA95JC96_9BACL|nr:MAG: holo-ACP synthase [Cohnella sp.]
MIRGVGLDVVELDRIASVLSGTGKDKFIARILTPSEQARLSEMSAKREIEFVAGRFAAKEAVVKALGCGIGTIVGFHDVEVTRNEQGKPICELSEAALTRLGLQKERCVVHIAITHERSLAAATAIVEELAHE